MRSQLFRRLDVLESVSNMASEIHDESDELDVLLAEMPPVRSPTQETYASPRELDPLYAAVADCSMALHTGGDLRGALRNVSAVADELAAQVDNAPNLT